MRVVHVINGLGPGGAEHMLYKVLSKVPPDETKNHTVISLSGEGVFGDKIKSLGVNVYGLNFKSIKIFSNINLIRNIIKNSDIVDSWLYHSDLITYFISKLMLNKKLIWNIRHSNLDKQANKKLTNLIIRINSKLSKRVDLITYNSKIAKVNHEKIGFDNKASKIIPNGFDLTKFSFNKEIREIKRKELQISSSTRVFITVGRWNIQKDYLTLLKSLERVKMENDNFKMLMIGSGLDNNNIELVGLISDFDLQENMILLGKNDEIEKYLSAADYYVSSSLGESFSNSIGEAMACELICIATDVGNSKELIDNSGYIVNSGDYLDMSDKIIKVLKGDLMRSPEAREIIRDKYDIDVVGSMYLNNYNIVMKEQ